MQEVLFSGIISARDKILGEYMSRRALYAIVGLVVGAALGSYFGVAGFGTAIAGTIPFGVAFAVIGWLLGERSEHRAAKAAEEPGSSDHSVGEKFQSSDKPFRPPIEPSDPTSKHVIGFPVVIAIALTILALVLFAFSQWVLLIGLLVLSVIIKVVIRRRLD